MIKLYLDPKAGELYVMPDLPFGSTPRLAIQVTEDNDGNGSGHCRECHQTLAGPSAEAAIDAITTHLEQGCTPNKNACRTCNPTPTPEATSRNGCPRHHAYPRRVK